MKIKFKKLHPDAVFPTKTHETDAGFDLTAVNVDIDKYGNMVCQYGIAVEIPKGYGGFIIPRSSVSKKSLVLANSVGLIDPDYRGELIAKFKPSAYFSTEVDDEFDDVEEVPFEAGDRTAQIVILEVPTVEFEEAEELSDTKRGQGGYGSTGK